MRVCPAPALTPFPSPFPIALPLSSKLHDRALIASGRFIWVLRLLDLPNDQLKGLGDILVVARAGLSPSTLILFRQLLSHFLGNLPLLWTKVTLVAHNHNWYPFRALWTVSLLADIAGIKVHEQGG